MKNIYRFFAEVIALAALVVGCVAEPDTTPEVDITTVRCTIPKIDVEEDFATGILDTLPVTRATFSGGNFLWSAGDKIGILPNTGAQIYFEVDNGAGTSTASFDGGDWAMKSTGTFYAYYPLYPDIFLSKDHVSVSYTGQTQSGNNNNLHTGDYWTLYTEGTTSEGNALNFSFNHLTSFFKTYVTVPAGTYTKITFSAPTEVFIKDGYFDLSAQTPTIVGTTMSDELCLDLQNVTFADETELTGYLVLAPVDITGVPITVTVYKDGEPAYEYTLTKANPMVAAKTYAFRATSITQLAASATQANALFAAGATSVSITEPLTEDMAIVLPNTSEAVTLILPTTASTSTLTVSYPPAAESYPATLSITGPEGADLDIRTPNSTVTVNGIAYDQVTSRTAANTCIIPAGVTVNTLKVVQGGVQVYGTVSQIDLSEQEDDAVINVSGTVASLLGEDDEEYLPATGVTLNQSSIDLKVGASETLIATVAPVGAYSKVTWTSSDESIASVSSAGVVTAVSIGSTAITAKTISGGFTASCDVIVGNDYVNLGLPSGILWAVRNIGADNPEDTGEFFAWGETESKSDFSWGEYSYCEGSETTMTKYCILSPYGIIDNVLHLDDEDDVAKVRLGGAWRMPTVDEFDELINSCTWTWITQNGIKGYRVTGINGNSLFLPTTGYKDGTTLKGSTSGYYWTSSLYLDKSSHGKRLSFNSNATNNGQAGRHYGFTVRPVFTNDPTSGVTGISLDKSSVSASVGESISLTATVSANTGAVNKGVQWSSSNTAVATVDYTGNVTAVSAGNATITAKTIFGGHTATCEFTVSEPDIFVEPLTFTSTGTTSISLDMVGTPGAISLYYKVDNGVWTCYDMGETLSLTNGESVSFRAGQTSNLSFSISSSNYYKFTTSGNGALAASGNILSLLNREGTDTIPSNCFRSLFKGCSNLTTSPELPATTLATYCYADMFSGCTSLISAPELPAATLAANCYAGMFSGCTSLISAPELPATNLAKECYWRMFYNCTSLQSPPTVLPATIAYDKSYWSMFSRCTSLTTAPELSATSMYSECCEYMFDGCTSLTTVPALPNASMGTYCCAYMFQGCTNLTRIELRSIQLTQNGCYYRMFEGCSKLNYVKALFIDDVSYYDDGYGEYYTSITTGWLSGTSSSGTFVKNKNAQWHNVCDPNVIPENWLVQEDDETLVRPGSIQLWENGPYWSSNNVGANNPWDIGLYFAWGETQGYAPKANDGRVFNWASYKLCKGTYNKLTKYCSKSSCGYNGYTDTKTVLDYSDDAATSWNSSWRMPTEEELRALINNCDWEWCFPWDQGFGGIPGYKVSGKMAGYTNRSIFLPVTDIRSDSYTGGVIDNNSYGNYWSSSLENNTTAYYLLITHFSSPYQQITSQTRNVGLCVRPIARYK